jgi:hypothetical protein
VERQLIELGICCIFFNSFFYVFNPASLHNLVNKTNLCMFISILYMFRATMCPSSGEITINTTPGICQSVLMTVWYAGLDGTSHPAYQTVIHTELQIPGVVLMQLFLLMMGT